MVGPDSGTVTPWPRQLQPGARLTKPGENRFWKSAPLPNGVGAIRPMEALDGLLGCKSRAFPYFGIAEKRKALCFNALRLVYRWRDRAQLWWRGTRC